ncbi:hypothetical protein L7F22_013106 [Adiantum nelumboides]|nr:hypothetical protein [Adiantum nelumboides]
MGEERRAAGSSFGTQDADWEWSQDRRAELASSDVEILRRVWRNEKAAPEILPYDHLLLQRIREQIHLMRVTKQSFMKWINQKNKGLSARELLREFEKKYEQLSSTEQRSIRSERVELFVQAADARLQKSLVQLFEDATGDLGLTLDWKLVPEAVNMIVKQVRHVHFNEDDDEEIIPRSHFTRNHWARATTETIVKLGDLEEPVLALVDHGSEINLMAKSLHQKGRWPIDVDHGWRIRAANMLPGDLYGACVNVKVTIGDVSD